LHVQAGLQALKEVTSAGRVASKALGDGQRLICAPEFLVDKIVVEQERDLAGSNGRTAQVLVAIAGCGVIEAPGASALTFTCGDAVIIPAALPGFHIRPQWKVELLRAELP
jgi:hypothetical protein